MNIFPLIFSNNPKYRITRHVLFWSAWVLYYTYFVSISWMRISFKEAFWGTLFEQILSTPMDMAFCYSVIYFLIPKYLEKGRYIMMVLLWLLFSVLFVICFRSYLMYIVPLLRTFDGLPMPKEYHSFNFTWSFFEWFSQINMEGCIAASIKLGKMWYIKQQELDLLKREKQKLMPKLQNGIMQPVFLVNTLDKVEALSQENPQAIPPMIKGIKNLLMYVIYDNNQSKVPLEKELKLLHEYIELEKTGNDKDLDVRLHITGNTYEEEIAPFLILSLAENSFRQLAMLQVKDKFIDLEIHVADGHFHMKISWSKPVDTSTLENGSNTFLHNISRRLQLLYPQSHQMRVVIEPNRFMVEMHIELRRAIN